MTLDTIDGDPDFQQDDGDSEDANAREDDFVEHGLYFGTGCPISDPDCAVDDMPCGADAEDGT